MRRLTNSIVANAVPTRLAKASSLVGMRTAPQQVRNFRATPLAFCATSGTPATGASSNGFSSVNDAAAWYNAVVTADPTKPMVEVAGKQYTRKECLAKSLEINSTANAVVWAFAGITLIGHRETTPQCFEALSRDDNNAETGIMVNGTHYSAVKCLITAVEMNPNIGMAWDALGTLLEAATIGRVAMGSMPAFVNVAKKNYTSIQCFAKAIEVENPLNPQYPDAIARGWQKLTYSVANRQQELDTVSGGAEEGYDVKKRTVSATVNGHSYDVLGCFVKLAAYMPEHYIVWYNIAALIAQSQSKAQKTFEETFQAYGAGEAFKDGSAIPTPPAPIVVRIGEKDFALADIIAKSIEVLGDDVVAACASWVQLGNCLHDQKRQQMLAIEVATLQKAQGTADPNATTYPTMKKPSAVVNGKSVEMLDCFVMAAEGAVAALKSGPTDGSAATPSAASVRSFAHVWHTLGAHMRDHDTVTVADKTYSRLEVFAKSAELIPNDSSAWFNLALILSAEYSRAMSKMVAAAGNTPPTSLPPLPSITVAGKAYQLPDCLSKSIELSTMGPNSGSLGNKDAWRMLAEYLFETDMEREHAAQSQLQAAMHKIIEAMQQKQQEGESPNIVGDSSMPAMPELPTVERATAVVNGQTVSATDCLIKTLCFDSTGLTAADVWSRLALAVNASGATPLEVGASAPKPTIIVPNVNDGNPITAIECQAKAVECDPANSEGWRRVGLMLIDASRSAVSSLPTNAEKEAGLVKEYRAQQVLINKEPFTMLDCFAKMFALAPNDPWACESLAQALEATEVASIEVEGQTYTKEALVKLYEELCKAHGGTGGADATAQ